MFRFSLVVLLVGTLCCFHPSPTPQTLEPAVVSSGIPLRSITSHIALTPSIALDRIDQRTYPLDGKFSHLATGHGVTVYVFDGGVDGDHPELAGRVRHGFNADSDTQKVCGHHGTAVAGAIAGKTLGVAPEAEIVDVKIFTCSPLKGTLKYIHDGVLWVIHDQEVHHTLAIANWSFVIDTTRNKDMDSIAVWLWRAGIMVIAAAGNYNTNACHLSPANAPHVFVVGSIIRLNRDGTTATRHDTRAPNSAWGPCIDIFAPGDSVLLPGSDTNNIKTSLVFDGTSFAAGYVSGAAALYLEQHPETSPYELGRALKRNATCNVIDNTGSPFSYLLYVGNERRPTQCRFPIPDIP